jgi:folate-binding protein YgfZ
MLGAGVALAGRRVLRVGGEDALKLLQGIVSNDVRRLAEPGAAPVYAAIQNAQGRVEHDVFLHREMGDGPSGGALLADLPAEGFDPAVSLLRKMRLRARVTLDDAGDDLAVVATVADHDDDDDEAGTEADPHPLGALAFLPPDPRLHILGLRGILPAAAAAALLPEVAPNAPHLRADGDAAYREWRYRWGVAEGTAELAGLLPLEANLEGLNAISFDKGCYIGQELTARTHHTGVIRKRLVPAHFAVAAPRGDGEDSGDGDGDGYGDGDETGDGVPRGAVSPGTPVRVAGGASGKPVGKVVASSGGVGLVMLRLARLEAMDAGEVSLVAGDGSGSGDGDGSGDGVAVRVRVPEWWPAAWRAPAT